MGFGLTERFDCVNWIDWVNEKTGGTLPIYLCGVSMGASTVLMTSAFALPDNVHGIIADCGYTSPQAIWKHVAQTNLHVTYDEWLSGIIDEMCKERIISVRPTIPAHRHWPTATSRYCSSTAPTIPLCRWR